MRLVYRGPPFIRQTDRRSDSRQAVAVKGELLLLRHNFSLPVCCGNGSATGTSRDGFCERVDQACSHGCDRVWNVTFRPQGRILWVDNLGVRQASGTAWWNEVLR